MEVRRTNSFYFLYHVEVPNFFAGKFEGVNVEKEINAL
jgi:hypothetical protein